ncbi:hypothetical protein [Candidatus Sulfurimonas baltica]|uniref:YbjN domain-containing protein n=1 Tax=Candidatus Sulfurimonas baltica TaxID=2740404 RepID=A0A7S7RP53_9BACT|nr:hypothetical protein [Candidatus Sulfurimonas baltica]QOY53234.1 hypothetical protein HUE88_06020 [Candidatus Sulfurimonas baltica]
MAISIEEVTKYIDEIGGSIIKSDSGDTVSIIAFSKYNNILEDKNSYIIYLLENGELIQFTNGIGSIKATGIDKCVLFESLLDHNSNTKFGTWDYDSNEDQINYTIEIPLEDNTLTEKQFKRIVKVLESGTVEIIKMIGELRNSSNSDGI